MMKKKKNSLTTVVLIIFFTLLLKPCTSFQLDHPSLLTTSLPRKLSMEKATKTTGRHVEPQVKAKDGIIGGLKKKDVKMMQITRQKWKEWEESHDQLSDLFTMDYRRVRRRRPIHNKSLLP